MVAEIGVVCLSFKRTPIFNRYWDRAEEGGPMSCFAHLGGTIGVSPPLLFLNRGQNLQNRQNFALAAKPVAVYSWLRIPAEAGSRGSGAPLATLEAGSREK